MTPQHPLHFQLQAFTKEANLSKLLGQIATGVVTAIVVRWAVAQVDAFIGRKTK